MKQTEQELVFSLQSWFKMFIAAVYVGQPVYLWELNAASLRKLQTLSDGELINATKTGGLIFLQMFFIIIGLKFEPIIALMWHFDSKKGWHMWKHCCSNVHLSFWIYCSFALTQIRLFTGLKNNPSLQYTHRLWNRQRLNRFDCEAARVWRVSNINRKSATLLC